MVAVAPAGSTIKRDDCTGGDPELVGKMRALLVAASTAAAIAGVMDSALLPVYVNMSPSNDIAQMRSTTCCR